LGFGRVHYRHEDLAIGILVLPQSEAQKAPRGPDELSVSRVPPGAEEEITTWQIMTTPHKYFYEAIVVAVFGSIADPEDVSKPIVRARFMNAAIEAARRFLTFSRALARDTLIYFVGQEVSTEHLHFIGFPHCESWWDLKSGNQLGDETINSCFGEVVGGRSGIEAVPWKKLQSAVQSLSQPPAHILALLDAQTAAVNYEDSKAVLLAAVGVEVAVKSFLQRTDSDKELLRLLEDRLELAFWEKYFHLLLTLVQQPSLKTAMPDLYKRIEILFRVRNTIAHEGICYYEKDDRGIPVVLRNREIWGLLNSARDAIDWLDTLSIPSRDGSPEQTNPAGAPKKQSDLNELVFAYGSNMDIEQMRERCPHSDLAHFVAEARGWRLFFPRRSEGRKGGVGSIERNADSLVWGVVFYISKDDLARLDRYEGVPAAYARERVNVMSVDGTRTDEVWTYIAVPQGAHFLPHGDYIGHYIRGAEHFGLPQEYIQQLKSIETLPEAPGSGQDSSLGSE